MGKCWLPARRRPLPAGTVGWRVRTVAGPHPPYPDARGGAIRPAPADDARRGRALLQLVLAVVLAGLLVAGLAAPWLGGAGVVAERGAGLLHPRQAEVVDVRLAGNTRVLAADGSLITEFFRRNRTPVPAEAMAPAVRDAVVAIEDARFFDHEGVDGEGLLRALARNLAAGEVVQGGSTLTQQLVKQLRLQTAEDPEGRTAATEQSVGRKLREAQVALAVEQAYSKDEILTRYLNTVYFGRGAYGIQAAARTWFSVDAVDLTLAQSATLAAVVNSPTTFDLVDAAEAATARRDRVLGRMADLGLVTRAAATAAQAEPLAPALGAGPPRGCVGAVVGGFACGHLLGELAALGLDRATLEAGGLVVQTSLDPQVQAAGDAAVRATLPETDSRAAIYTAVEPGTGRVLAMSVNRVYGVDAADPAQTVVDLPDAAGQGAGSTYKVFTAVAALEAGYGLDHTITTSDPYTSTVYRDGGEAYDVGNAGRYPGTLDMERALYMSSNTYFLALEDALGSVAGPVSAAQRMGLSSLDPIADRVVAENRGSFTFGAEPTSPLALTSAYATLAASGTQCDPHLLVAVTDRAGEPLLDGDGAPLVPADRCTPGVIAPGIADTVTQALRKDVEPGHPGQTGRAAYVPGHQIAGKTGTSQDNYSIAFVGYTPQLAAGVMVYDPVQNQDVGGFGGGKAATIWHDAMAPVLGAREAVPFPPADPAVVRGTRSTSPTTSPTTEAPPEDAEPMEDAEPTVEPEPTTEPPTTAPPTTQPPTTQPPTTQPPTTQPPTTQPPTTEPPVTEPPTTAPPPTQPPTTEPAPTQPPTTEPDPVQPTAPESSATGSSAPESSATAPTPSSAPPTSAGSTAPDEQEP
ncbi:transglycosylase domain-containing protein [Klenkia sp. LSe6-5]|uniref:Transglycosylase domain-containing protein n=1 Tax=Klenkia sesuvii TaxID=3103137 RepID=A0ABU8DWK7_9ACTN